MGIKHFFSWFQKHHEDCIRVIPSNASLIDYQVVDALALDLNGIFHPCAQKIFKYGAHEQNVRLTTRSRAKPMSEKRLDCFKQICTRIDELVRLVNPKKRLFLCIDGVAGAGKINQMRSRRFKSTQTAPSTFDSCSITPGTKFMHHLSQYIDWYVHHKIQNGDWIHLDIVFSSEKVPGEGEHTAINLFKKVCDPSERMMIYGLDADLIMLCLATCLPNIYVYRDNMYNASERFIIDVGFFSKKIHQALGTPSAVLDFIFLCFLVGNDFLPQIPGLEILNNGIELILDAYKKVCVPWGIIVPKDKTIRVNTFLKLCKYLAPLELNALKSKYRVRNKYHEDPLMEKFFKYDMSVETNDGFNVECNFDAFKKAYYAQKLPQIDVNNLCIEYIKGMQWVIQYYTIGIQSWTWSFPYHYGPFLDDLWRCEGYEISPHFETRPLSSFEQLLAVLPPQSKGIVPNALACIMNGYLYPNEFVVDVSGKRAEWEGIALIPHMDYHWLKEMFEHQSKYLSPTEAKRNEREENVQYIILKNPKCWKNLFGDIKRCIVGSVII